MFQETAAVTNFVEATLPDGGIIGNLPSSSSGPVTTLEDDMPNTSSSANMLDDVFVLPTYIRKASKRKNTNPFCKVLTSDNFMESKRAKLKSKPEEQNNGNLKSSKKATVMNENVASRKADTKRKKAANSETSLPSTQKKMKKGDYRRTESKPSRVKT